MSGCGQTRRRAYPRVVHGTGADFKLYGLDETGETVSTEQLRLADRQELSELARARLGKFHAVEIWEGPLCVLRLKRKSEEQA